MVLEKKVTKSPKIKAFDHRAKNELEAKPYQNDNSPNHSDRIKCRILESYGRALLYRFLKFQQFLFYFLL